MSKRKTCKATTSRGTRCSRIAVDKGCCRQHYKSVYGSKSKVASPRRFTIGKVLSVYKGCPPGTMRRKGYTRRAFIRASGSKVKGSKVHSECIPDRGMKGRIWKLEHESLGIGPLKKGELSQYGYHYDVSEKTRHTAIRKAIKKYGSLPMVRKLNALAVYNSKRYPSRSKIYSEDRDYASKIHEKEKK